MNITSIRKVIEREIEWSLDNFDKDLSKNYQKGFVKGLKQALFMLKKFDAIEKMQGGK